MYPEQGMNSATIFKVAASAITALKMMGLWSRGLQQNVVIVKLARGSKISHFHMHVHAACMFMQLHHCRFF
jgi:hypothetical protein